MTSKAALQVPTKRQAEVFRWVREYFRENRMAPTVREVQEAFEWQSPAGAMEHMRGLAAKGWLAHRERVARAFVPTQEALEHDA